MLPRLRMDPPLIGYFHREEDPQLRERVALEELPQHLVDAFLVAARQHAGLVAAQVVDAAENDIGQGFRRRRLRSEDGKPCLLPGGRSGS